MRAKSQGVRHMQSSIGPMLVVEAGSREFRTVVPDSQHRYQLLHQLVVTGASRCKRARNAARVHRQSAGFYVVASERQPIFVVAVYVKSKECLKDHVRNLKRQATFLELDVSSQVGVAWAYAAGPDGSVRVPGCVPAELVEAVKSHVRLLHAFYAKFVFSRSVCKDMPCVCPKVRV